MEISYRILVQIGIFNSCHSYDCCFKTAKTARQPHRNSAKSMCASLARAAHGAMTCRYDARGGLSQRNGPMVQKNEKLKVIHLILLAELERMFPSLPELVLGKTETGNPG